MSFLCLAVEQMHRYFLQHTHRLLWQTDGEMTAGHNNTHTHTDTDSLLNQFCSSHQLLFNSRLLTERSFGTCRMNSGPCACWTPVCTVRVCHVYLNSKCFKITFCPRCASVWFLWKVSLKQILYVCSKLLLLKFKGTISTFLVNRLSIDFTRGCWTPSQSAKMKIPTDILKALKNKGRSKFAPLEPGWLDSSLLQAEAAVSLPPF